MANYQKIVISEEILIHLGEKPFRYFPVAVILIQSTTNANLGTLPIHVYLSRTPQTDLQAWSCNSFKTIPDSRTGISLEP